MIRIYLFIGLSIFATLTGYSQGWIKQESNTNVYLRSVCFVNPDIGFVVGNDGTVLKTINGGNEWQIKQSGTSNHLLSVHFIDSLTGFAISYHELLKTTNGGESWFVQDTVNNNAFFHDMHFIDKDTGFVSGNTMLKTVNGGANWVKQISLGGSFFSFWATDSKNMYIGADYFLIYKSTDGGETWIVSNGRGFPVNMWDLCFINQNTGYAIGDGFAQGSGRAVLLNTTDGGATWSDLLVMSGIGFNSMCFVNDRTGFISGSNGTLLKTTDAGHHWI
ncbi:MAG: YCF48-related protein, partial [Bacteroidia bacterium]|nr:YCF48-related protein [Bacteroidia bacterium]